MPTETAIVLECNIDDATGEVLGYALARLLEEGARDAYFLPVFGKKNRPGVLLQVICDAKTRQRLLEVLFAETGTLGVREYGVTKHHLVRQRVRMKTSLGDLAVKIASSQGKVLSAKPEFEDVKKIAQKRKMPLRSALAEINKEISSLLERKKERK